ncbi:FAD-dependent oxidoreductase [Blastopirellula marina]|uniref:FAD-dependent oxidoreductase n=1 Tax=Blastopirellula marina TaxID=124 RepID=A0A2S8F882_9BACT|nr:FAD-dependent oxidoreductase [Blastopirellula marina]PQO28340.1 FAD-dependent oxidoreductase [Blastopirellula marina]PTL41880.1 FAD-dependent oxidoreductase [Blastopirellula marina]
MPQPLSRRQVLAASVSGVLLPAALYGAESQTTDKPNQLTEAARTIPVAGTTDVLVCGGGPAGIAAAISAARTGASVKILEAHGCLGGVWTSGMLSYVMDAEKPGLNAELPQRLKQMDAQRQSGPKNYVYDVESMKVLLEQMCDEDKIGVQYHTRIVAVEKDASKRVRGVITESKSGRQAWRANTVIDTTGDGDVGALAGCEWEFGREQDCPCQPMSLMGIITASPEALQQFDRLKGGQTKDQFREFIQAAGRDPSYAKPTLWYLGGSVAAVMMNHEYGVRPFDAAAVTEATIRARRELYEIARALRSQGGAWQDCKLVTTAEQIGVRDGRRIKGRYFVTVDDVRTGARHEDAVCRSEFSVDIHAATREANTKAAYHNDGVKAKPFDIPLRALIARDVDGLMMAGRCISGDFFAHASYRVTGNAVAMGEAAGIASALAAKHACLPQDVAWKEVEAELTRLRKPTV